MTAAAAAVSVQCVCCYIKALILGFSSLLTDSSAWWYRQNKTKQNKPSLCSTISAGLSRVTLLDAAARPSLLPPSRAWPPDSCDALLW